MESPTSIYVGGGIVAVAICTLVIPRLKRRYARAAQSEDGHGRSEQREERWYALDDPITIDLTQFKEPTGLE